MEIGELLKRKEFLEKVVAKVNHELPKLPKGNIRIAHKGKRAEYYLITEKNDTNGKYLQVGERKIAELIVKREYYNKLLLSAKAEIKAIINYIDAMALTKVEDVYTQMSDCRRGLVNPLIENDEEWAKRWQEEPYETNPYEPEQKVFATKRGDMVRSKSEAMIADMYYDMGIPYRYECAFHTKSGRVKYPDFTCLKVSERKVIYHEHMGLLDDREYRFNNLKKISEYMESGMNFCDNFLLTFETDYCPFNSKIIRSQIKRIFFT